MGIWFLWYNEYRSFLVVNLNAASMPHYCQHYIYNTLVSTKLFTYPYFPFSLPPTPVHASGLCCLLCGSGLTPSAFEGRRRGQSRVLVNAVALVQPHASTLLGVAL